MNNDIIVEIRPSKTSSALKAMAEVTVQTALGELTISKLKIIHEEGKDAWVAYPDITYKPKGSDDYRRLKIVLPSKRLDQAIKDAVLEKYSTMKFEDVPF